MAPEHTGKIKRRTSVKNDPLRMADKPFEVIGTLSGEGPTSVIPVDSEQLDRLAEMVWSILKSDTDEDFKRRLGEIARWPQSIALHQTVNTLGCYDSQKKTITIDRDKISRCAAYMRSQGQNISDSVLQRVVQIHEEAHALHHLAQDSSNNDRIWDEFSQTPSYLLETLAQLFAHQSCCSDQTLKTTFLELEKRQPIEYRLWRLFKYFPQEELYWMVRDHPDRIDGLLEKLGFDLPPKTISGWGIRRIAKEIDDDKEGKIRGQDIPDLIRKGYPYPANCYPGEPGKDCFETSFFVSLTARRYANPDKGHLSFRETLGYFVRHMQIQCSGTTKQAVLLTDNWDPDAYDEWKPVIDELKHTEKIEAFLITGGTYSNIRI
jgi:hypothetical protein